MQTGLEDGLLTKENESSAKVSDEKIDGLTSEVKKLKVMLVL